MGKTPRMVATFIRFCFREKQPPSLKRLLKYLHEFHSNFAGIGSHKQCSSWYHRLWMLTTSAPTEVTKHYKS